MVQQKSTFKQFSEFGSLVLNGGLYGTKFLNDRAFALDVIGYHGGVQVVPMIHRMDKRKSFVFTRQYRNCFFRRINTPVLRN